MSICNHFVFLLVTMTWWKFKCLRGFFGVFRSLIIQMVYCTILTGVLVGLLLVWDGLYDAAYDFATNVWMAWLHWNVDHVPLGIWVLAALDFVWIILFYTILKMVVDEYPAHHNMSYTASPEEIARHARYQDTFFPFGVLLHAFYVWIMCFWFFVGLVGFAFRIIFFIVTQRKLSFKHCNLQ